MLSAKSLGTAEQESRRSTEVHGADIVQNSIGTNLPRSRLQLLFDATKPPGGETKHHCPAKREGGQCKEKLRRKVIHSRLRHLAGTGLDYTSASSS